MGICRGFSLSIAGSLAAYTKRRRMITALSFFLNHFVDGGLKGRKRYGRKSDSDYFFQLRSYGWFPIDWLA
jgi:ATP-dependent protease ClpP protease subunit